MTAEKRFGLYSALRACKAICFRSNFTPRFTVDTTFCNSGTIPEVLLEGKAAAVAAGATADELDRFAILLDTLLFAFSSAEAEEDEDDALLLVLSLFPFCADMLCAMVC